MCFWKNKTKQITRCTVQLCIWPRGENVPRPASTRPPRPAAQQPTAGPPKRLAPRARLAESGPKASGCRWPSIALDLHPTAVRTHRVIKTPQRRPAQTLASFLLSPPPHACYLWAVAGSVLPVAGDGRWRWRAAPPGTRPQHAPPFLLSLLPLPLFPSPHTGDPEMAWPEMEVPPP
jgi:hypothetical protein